MKKTAIATFLLLSAGVLGAPKANAVDAQPFTVGAVYAYPNPVRESSNVTIHADVTEESDLEIQVYDLTGHLVHEDHVSGGPEVVQGKLAYEYQWNPAGLPSGSYVFLVRGTSKNGQQSAAHQRFMIIR